MIEAVLSLICLHTPIAMRQSVRAALLTLTTWLASLLLAIATTTDGFRGHVNRGVALGAQTRDWRRIVLPAANMEVVW